MEASPTLDVFGKCLLVERIEGTWQTCLLGADRKRSPVNVGITASAAERELVQSFDDLYHEAVTNAQRIRQIA
jgi:hypothetical protein